MVFSNLPYRTVLTGMGFTGKCMRRARHSSVPLSALSAAHRQNLPGRPYMLLLSLFRLPPDGVESCFWIKAPASGFG
nr:MAG TPA: hypothetical protein [Caudoviricetes sp.]